MAWVFMYVCVCARVCVWVWACVRVCGWQCPPRPLTAVYPAPVYGQYAQAPSPQLAPIPHNKVEGKPSTCPATQVHILISFLPRKILPSRGSTCCLWVTTVNSLCIGPGGNWMKVVDWGKWCRRFLYSWLAPLPGHWMSWCMPPLPMCLPLHETCMLNVLFFIDGLNDWLFLCNSDFLCQQGGWHTSQNSLTVIWDVAQHSLQLLTSNKA